MFHDVHLVRQGATGAFQAPAPLPDLRFEKRLGFGVVIGTICALLVWASLARLDAAIAMIGQIKVAGDRQSVQTLSGGNIASIAVVDGQKVAKGQLLLTLSGDAAAAQERSLATRVIAAYAQIARLEAELGGREITTPRELEILTGADAKEAEQAMSLARSELQAARATDQTRAALLSQQVAQINEQVVGRARRKETTQRQIELSRKELGGIEALAAKGYATQTRVVGLQRAVAALQGDAASQEAEIAGLQSNKGSARLQLLQWRRDADQQRTIDLRAARTELQTLLPQWSSARDVVARSRIVAPVAGTVMNLHVRAAGQVAAPGETLLEVVPQDRSLTIEAKTGVEEINDLHEGAKATVEIVGLHGRTGKLVEGKIEAISPDSSVDERSGRSFFKVQIRVPASELARVQRDARLTQGIRPGSTAIVHVNLYKRTALQYWLEPLFQAFSPGIRP
ncbi:HlyD family type I secretion periplasmic adaptor subunit [Sphingomonas crocodyli]|uniref:Membrane fusion protein (MFP) family protein n=1 Tax=Sphingomonas crocodyli TaxID=1979270 RepID=A0A437LXN4_9SPHN|nr:HlyD family type I secretion periplasmic adaptor subunit [Sphingomonas crocodyli]RVT90171.1 HlyD family type I secretion periplasmic adaptor subunit [Sphingomonas crocodyli]